MPESLKNLDKITGGELLARYPEVDWKKANGSHDFVAKGGPAQPSMPEAWSQG